MRIPRVENVRSWPWPWLLGGLLSLATTVVVDSGFGINNPVTRDQAIYLYGGQQLSHGVPPYVSVFDAKTPLATMLAGLADAIGRGIGRNDLYVVRAAFFACACLTVLAVYLLAARLWRSVPAGLAAAVVYASFEGFARDALAGPEAKSPGLLFAVVSMWLLLRRQWFWAGAAASLAFLAWQPFVFYGVVACVAAVVCSDAGRRLRGLAWAVAGAVVPVVACVVYFASVGALGKFFEGAVEFPIVGVNRGSTSLSARIDTIVKVIRNYFEFSAVLFWIGVVALVLLVALHLFRLRRSLRIALADPLVCVVALSFLAEAAYALTDFQSYPDALPLLVYPALGLGGLAALALHSVPRVSLQRLLAAAIVVVLAVLAGLSWSWFTNSKDNTKGFIAQSDEGCAVNRIVVPGTSLYSLGDPTPLVFTHRRSPDRFIFLDAGVDRWKINHTAGGMDGWIAQIESAAPSVIVMKGWRGSIHSVMGTRLRAAGYLPAHVGRWLLFLTRDAWAYAKEQGVLLTPTSTAVPLDVARRRISCPNP